MRLGGPVKADNPQQWVQALREAGYAACYFPGGPDSPGDVIDAYVKAASDANLVIAEVGAWSNPISPDEAQRRDAITKCVKCLALAERVGARCCVNIVGSRNPAKWDGPHVDNLSDATFDLIVESVRHIIDAVKPTRTCYALETMPWVFPDSPDSYLRLLKAIDRKACGVHLDPVNMINSPRRYYDNAAFLRECFAKLGDRIVSCHAKDILLQNKLTVHLDEMPVGQGAMDYVTYLRELDKLPADTPLMLEHCAMDQYPEAARRVREFAKQAGVTIR